MLLYAFNRSLTLQFCGPYKASCWKIGSQPPNPPVIRINKTSGSTRTSPTTCSPMFPLAEERVYKLVFLRYGDCTKTSWIKQTTRGSVWCEYITHIVPVYAQPFIPTTPIFWGNTTFLIKDPYRMEQFKRTAGDFRIQQNHPDERGSQLGIREGHQHDPELRTSNSPRRLCWVEGPYIKY